MSYEKKILIAILVFIVSLWTIIISSWPAARCVDGTVWEQTRNMLIQRTPITECKELK